MMSLYRVPAPGKPNQASGHARNLRVGFSVLLFIAIAFLTASPGFTWEYWGGGQAAEGAACRSRIFMGTNDVRVIALDAKTGVPCADFGDNGQVKIDVG